MRRRLVITVPPIAGESLMSLIVRHCQANLVARPADLLSEIGIETAAPGFLPFTQDHRAADLAAAFGTTVEEVRRRLHPADVAETSADRVIFNGIALERRFLEAKIRRLSPLTLKTSRYHRALWQIRPLTFCPESMELLVEACSACGKDLGWTRCHDLSRCDRCNEPLDWTTTVVSLQFQDTASSVAKLLGEVDDERRRVLAALPAPFCDWDAGDVFAAIVELGAAVTTPPDQASRVNQKIAAGDFRDFGLAELDAGLRLIVGWPESFNAYVLRGYERTQSASWKGCLGGLAKYLVPAARPSPLRDLVRTHAVLAVNGAGIPLKRHSRLISSTSREGVVSAREAETRYGVTRKQLCRLQGSSPTYRGGQSTRGGTALYDVIGLERLVAARDATLPYAAAGKLLGVPAFAIPTLVSSGLLGCPTEADLDLIYPGSRRVVKATALELIARVKELPVVAKAEAARLETALQRFPNPNAWAIAIDALLRREVDVCEHSADPTLLATTVDLPQVHRVIRSIMASKSDGVVSCLAASRMLGATSQFVAAAARAGILNGAVGDTNSTISVNSISTFAKEFMLNAELSRRLKCTPVEVRYRMRDMGLTPERTIATTNIWNRKAFETALA